MLKTSLTLFFVVSVIFSTIYTPQAILPTLKEVFHLSIAQTNLLLSGMLFVLMVVTPLYAPIAKRWEKKKIMMLSLFFLFIAVGLSAWATSYELLLISRVMQGIFIPGITAIMLSYVLDIYPKEHRGLGMGVYMAATGFGAVMGRLLAGWMTYVYSYQETFGLFALLLLVALLAMAVGLPRIEQNMAISNESNKSQNNILSYITNSKALAILLIPMVVFFSFMAITTFITYHLAQAPFALNDQELGSLFLVLLLAVVVSPLAGRYSDRLGRVQMLFWALGSLVAGILLTLSGSLAVILIGLGLVTVGMFSVQSVAPTYLGELFPNERAKVAVLLYQMFFYFGGAMGTLVPAWVWDFGGYAGVVWFCVGLVSLGVIPIILKLCKRS
ncbi:MAG: MFS transporter [Sulfurovum sp.]|nr:MFS transporter [Sulfurovum sp.]MCB4762615.1 MFS transporter [Sulfurovum sp.]MCB4781996.1 MFS transporter [Sulfurovum sp.]